MNWIELIQWIIEFFFCHFWHFLGLAVLTFLAWGHLTWNRKKKE